MKANETLQSRRAGADRHALGARGDLTLPEAVGAHGANTLPGLSPKETEEFLRLDQTLPYDGLFVWPDDLPAIPSEERWRILWAKQRAVFGG